MSSVTVLALAAITLVVVPLCLSSPLSAQKSDSDVWPSQSEASTSPVAKEATKANADKDFDLQLEAPSDLRGAPGSFKQGEAIKPAKFAPSANAKFRNASSAKANLTKPAKPSNPENSKPLAPKSTDKKQSTNRQVGTSDFTMAAQPKFGAHAKHESVQTDAAAVEVDPSVVDFGPTPVDPYLPYDPSTEMWIYEGKQLNANRRPLIELGKPWYQLGQLPQSSTVLGSHNLVSPQFVVYGDYRMAYANNRVAGGEDVSQFATELNLNFDLRITATERFTAFVAPLDGGKGNTRWLTGDDQFVEALDFDVDFGMFEGDLGAIVGGAVGQTLPFDLPFAVGVMPLLFQNGIWMEDAVLGVAATLPAKNSPALDISNMDITFFAAYDNIDSPAFEGDNDVAKMYGVATFIEAMGGYFEIDYAFLEDRDDVRDRSYHNIGFGFTRRYGRFISNSIRVIANAGQSTAGGPNTADGAVVLIESSFITSRPQTFVPYFNFFAGFDRPQSASRAAAAGGLLRNTGILFESDGMTGYPTLDGTANDTWGGAIGLNIISQNFDQQLVLELAAVQVMNGRNRAARNAYADQYGAGVRYQIPLSNALILRTDAMYGVLRDLEDIHGARMELRYKF